MQYRSDEKAPVPVVAPASIQSSSGRFLSISALSGENLAAALEQLNCKLRENKLNKADIVQVQLFLRDLRWTHQKKNNHTFIVNLTQWMRRTANSSKGNLQPQHGSVSRQTCQPASHSSWMSQPNGRKIQTGSFISLKGIVLARRSTKLWVTSSFLFLEVN